MPIRISGMASGMDIDKMVRDLMRVERIPLDRLEQKKQSLEWQRDDYRQMNALLYDLDQAIFSGINKQKTFSEKTVSSSNEAAVTAKNINSTYNINTSIRVDQLAEAAYMNSSGDIRSDTTFDPNNILADERSKLNTDFTTNSFTIQAINSNGTLGEEITIDFDPSTESLNNVLDKINKSAAGVNAFYDSQTGRISITAKNTGNVAGAAEIKLSGDFLTGALGFAEDNILAGANGNEGKNAVFNINGIDTERNSNIFQINGYEYTLRKVTDNGDGITQSGELVNISSTTNTDAIYKSIEDFVNKYNEIIDSINKKISEERYRSYSPLTNDQRSGLSDKEIELWEEKARSGLLRNDFYLKTGLSRMREDLYTPVTGLNPNYDHISEIGIETSKNYKDNGKLVIDEAKLKAAIENDPLVVYDLFNKRTRDADGNLIKGESGIAVRLRESIASTMDGIEAKAGNASKPPSSYSLGTSLTDIQRKITDYELKLFERENQLWKEFTAMEKAIQESNEQMAYLSSQLGYM